MVFFCSLKILVGFAIFHDIAMANSDFLRGNINQHAIKNSLSSTMDKDIIIAKDIVLAALWEAYPHIEFTRKKKIYLKDIVSSLKTQFPHYADKFTFQQNASFITPDGWFLFAKNKHWEVRVVLIAEVKRQWTNNKRKEEGKDKQAKWNAIERLGKNILGIKAMMKSYGYIPFICFGHGCDFEPWSSILDRVVTMNEFFPLNEIFIEKDFLPFEPVTMCFREEERTVQEMYEKMLTIAKRSIDYRFN